MNTDTKPPRTPVSFPLILIVIFVIGVVVTDVVYLWRATDGDQSAKGRFIVMTAMSPLLVLVFTSFFFRVFRYFTK